MQNPETLPDSNLVGTLYALKICDLGIAISCADCPSPFVGVYDKNFKSQFLVSVEN